MGWERDCPGPHNLPTKFKKKYILYMSFRFFPDPNIYQRLKQSVVLRCAVVGWSVGDQLFGHGIRGSGGRQSLEPQSLGDHGCGVAGGRT